MHKNIPYAVVVFPETLLNYFKSVVDKATFSSQGIIDTNYFHVEDGMCSIIFHGSEDDYYVLEAHLTGAYFPYNYYPKVLDEYVTFVRLINDGTDVSSRFASYVTFLTQKHIDLPHKREHIDYLIKREHNWENQVELCLKQSVLNLLEE